MLEIKKKIFSAVIIAIMLLLIPISVYADAFKIGDWECIHWTNGIDDEFIGVIEYNGNEKILIIPTELKGLPVRGVSISNENVKEIIVPSIVDKELRLRNVKNLKKEAMQKNMQKKTE